MKDNLCIFQNLKSTDIRREPFTYLCIQNCLPEKIYNELASSFIELDMFDYKKSDNNICYRISAKKYLTKKSNLWKEFIDYHTSQIFYDKVCDIFEKDLLKFNYNILRKKIGVRNDLRYKTKFFRCKINLDCQKVINTPVIKESEVVEPHLDNILEIYAGLLYMKYKDDKFNGGDLVIYQYINKKLYGKARANKSDIKPVDSIKYAANNLAFFINSPFSIHGVSSRRPNPNFRRYVNIIGESEVPLFSIKDFI